jgi:hypothetical protein
VSGRVRSERALDVVREQRVTAACCSSSPEVNARSPIAAEMPGQPDAEHVAVGTCQRTAAMTHVRPKRGEFSSPNLAQQVDGGVSHGAALTRAGKRKNCW